MTQLDFGFPTRAPRGVSWERIRPYQGHADYLMRVDGQPAGIFIEWCGHPTALRPYTVRLPNGANLDIYDGDHDPRGLPFTTFRTVADAKAAAITWREKR